MSTIRKTISISNKDKQLQEIIKNVPNYEVSHVIRQLMYDGIKYRTLVQQGKINDFNVEINYNYGQNDDKDQYFNEKPLETSKKTQILEENDEIYDEIDINSIELEEIEENSDDLEDILLKNG